MQNIKIFTNTNAFVEKAKILQNYALNFACILLFLKTKQFKIFNAI